MSVNASEMSNLQLADNYLTGEVSRFRNSERKKEENPLGTKEMPISLRTVAQLKCRRDLSLLICPEMWNGDDEASEEPPPGSGDGGEKGVSVPRTAKC